MQRRIALIEAARAESPPSYGPHTAGSTIYVDGVPVQLPQDVYVAGVVVSALCGVGTKCFPAPVIGLQSGESVFRISSRTGHFEVLRVSPGEEGSFDALINQLIGLGFRPYDPS